MKDYDPVVIMLTKLFHNSYERHAVLNGWETQAASRKEWDEIPESNKATMLDMMEECLPVILAGTADGLERVAKRLDEESPYNPVVDGIYIAADIIKNGFTLDIEST